MLRTTLGSESTAVVSGSLLICRTDTSAPQILCNVSKRFDIPRFNPRYDVLGVAMPCTKLDTTTFAVKLGGVAHIATSTANIPVGHRIGIQFENNTRFAIPMNHYARDSWNVAVPVAFKPSRDTANMQRLRNQSGVWRSMGCKKRFVGCIVIHSSSLCIVSNSKG